MEEQEISLEVITKPYPPLLYPSPAGVQRFKNLQEAIDTPFVATDGPLKTLSFSLHGTTFYLHIFGHLPLPDTPIEKLFSQFTEPMHALFGSFPFQRYDYLIFCTPETRYHGVEHKNSTVITLPFDEDADKNLRDLLGIASHELFHAWNVCRIRPRALQPYRLKAPVYFDIGYVLEGFTSYYGDLMLWRGGCLTEEEWLEELNRRLRSHYSTTGRHTATLRSSSLRLWENAYTPESLASEVSIYTRGMLAAWGTDLAIRKWSAGANSLDAVLRAMWEQFPEQSEGYTHADIQALVKKAGGEKALELFNAMVDSTQSLENLIMPLLEEGPYALEETEVGYGLRKR
jgi:predicted metalloprotease with PDZ domain